MKAEIAEPHIVLSRFLTIIASLFLFFILGEGLIRFLEKRILFYDIEMSRYANELKEDADDPSVGHIHRPRAHAILMGVPVETNNDGFRDRDYSVKAAGKYRIIFLGDSLTLGWGVRRENTFEYLLENSLNGRYPTEIINFGIGNYNAEQETNLFIKKGLKYHPDRVVVFFFINDAEPLPKKSHWGFLGRSHLLTFYWSRIQLLLNQRDPSRNFVSYYRRLYLPNQPGWNRLKESFLTLKTICDTNRISLQVVLLPELHSLKEYPFQKEHDQVKSFLREHQIAHLDLAPFFKGEMNPERLWVTRDDAHPNVLGHRLIADYSFDFLAQSLPRQTNAR